MAHNDHHHVSEPDHSKDSAIDAIAATVIILCVAAMAIFWVSGQ